MEDEPIYLDWNATAPLDPAVREAMEPFLGERFANPSSPHPAGGRVREAVEKARERVAVLLGGESAEVVFTSGATEGSNQVIQGLRRDLTGGTVVTSAIEHPSVLQPVRALWDEGFDVVEIGPDPSGVIPADRFVEALEDHDTRLACLMAANNETGVRQPLETVARAAGELGVPLHADLVQVAGRASARVPEGVTTAVISGHKLGGPKGVGALWRRGGTDLPPLLLGGAQEGGRRAGTEDVPGIIGLGVAARLAADRWSDDGETMADLRDRFEAELADRVEVVVHGAGAPRLPNTSSFRLPGVEARMLITVLGRDGIHVSSGSACSSGTREPSHVLGAMGVSDPGIRETIRVSIGRTTTADEIDRAVEAIAGAAGRLGRLD